MKNQLSIGCCLLVPFVVVWSGCATSDLPLPEPQTGWQLAKEYRELLQNETEIEREIANPDSGISLAAGWQRLRLLVPEEKGDEATRYEVPADQLHRFLGLVEGTVDAPVPDQWTQALLSAGAYHRNNFSFPHGFAPKDRRPTYLSEIEGCRILYAGQQWELPVTDSFPPDCFAADETKDAVFLAAFSWPPFEYPLYCFDKKTGDVKWSTTVWANGGIVGSYSGLGYHLAWIASNTSTIYVFGVSHTLIYIEAFDINDGTPLWRFSNYYLESEE